MANYEEIFRRNYGVFSEKQQERIKRARILIIGCGGVGGTVAVALARSGVENFILVEHDTYEVSNINRQIACYMSQIACFKSTIGRNKAEVIKEQINSINSQAKVEIITSKLPHSEIAQMIPRVNIVIPVTDDIAYNIIVLRDAQRIGRPGLMIYPSGLWANVGLILPDSPPVTEIGGEPEAETYEELKSMYEQWKYRIRTYYYTVIGGWRIDYYKEFLENKAPLAQICPHIWMVSSLGALEVLKFLTGKGKPVVSPRYWSITEKGIRLCRINGFSAQTVHKWICKFMWWSFNTPIGPFVEKLQKKWWHYFYIWKKRRERRHK